MKTIAITIDDDTLNHLDQLVASDSPAGKRRSRSRIIRDAVREYILARQRLAAEQQESAVLRRHRARLMKQTRAAVREQAKP